MYSIKNALSLFYPKYCINCKKVTLSDGLCSECWNNVTFLSQPACVRCYCQFVYTSTPNDICSKCSTSKYYVDSIRAPFSYTGIMPNIILRYKNMAEFNLVKFFVKIIINNFDYSKINYIVPVPLNKWRLFWRGYNQSQLLARSIGKELNITTIDNMLIRNRFTKSQSNFNRIGRGLNIKNAFTLNTDINLKNKHILLIDDVCTTGATLEECAKLLKKNGAEQVHACVIAKT